MNTNIVYTILFLLSIAMAIYMIFYWRELSKDYYRYNPKGCSGCNY